MTWAPVAFGLLVATLVSSLSVFFAFTRQTVRYVRARAAGELGRYSDRLCAGIWTSAAGAALACFSGLFRMTTGTTLYWLSAVAWLLVGLGYFMHFTAWRLSFMDVEAGFSIRWAVILVAVAVSASGLFAFLT